jgi:CRISPR-associated protein Cmr3
MQSTPYFIRPHSPLVFRSGRPFGDASADASASSDSYDFPLPSSIAGALRAAWVDASDHAVTKQDQTLLGLEVHGGLRAVRTGEHQGTRVNLFAPQPADAMYQRRLVAGWKLGSLSPALAAKTSGVGLAHGLLPVMSTSREKPLPGPADWSMGSLTRWMAGDLVDLPHQESLDAVPYDRRSHVVISQQSQTAIDGGLFQSDGLDFSPGTAQAMANGDHGILAWLQTKAADLKTNAAAGRLARIGADGRAATLDQVHAASVQDTVCPPELARKLNALKVGGRFRLLLLTPACYLRNGWYPDGLHPSESGDAALPIEGCLTHLNTENSVGKTKDTVEGRWQFRLCAAAFGRWQPLAGSSTRDDMGAMVFTRRPLRRLVPAGAVYWLEIVQKSNRPLADLWMQSTCRTEFARDGFGLAIPGLVL